MLKKVFKIDNQIYPKDTINTLIPLFEGYNIVLLPTGEIEIASEADDHQVLFDEFMNYLLAYLNE